MPDIPPPHTSTSTSMESMMSVYAIACETFYNRNTRHFDPFILLVIHSFGEKDHPVYKLNYRCIHESTSMLPPPHKTFPRIFSTANSFLTRHLHDHAMSSPGYGDEKSQGRPRLAAAPACEACRRLKVFPVFLPPPIKPSLTTQMKCTRAAEARENPLSDPLSEPCDRCKRTDRPCKTPESRPLGRRRGALGRYRGLEKAYRKLQAEAKKANIPHDLDERFDTIPLHSAEEELGFDSFLVDEPSDHPQINTTTDVPAIPGTPVLGPEVRRPRTAIQDENHGDAEDHNTPTHEPMSNPLALLAYASDAAQAAEARSTSVNTLPSPSSRRQTGPRKGESEGHRLLHRPGYVSLGLQLDRASLVQGLDGLLACLDAGHQSLDYFKRTSVRQRDVGPDLDPVELGLVTMDEANYLFPM